MAIWQSPYRITALHKFAPGHPSRHMLLSRVWQAQLSLNVFVNAVFFLSRLTSIPHGYLGFFHAGSFCNSFLHPGIKPKNVRPCDALLHRRSFCLCYDVQIVHNVHPAVARMIHNLLEQAIFLCCRQTPPRAHRNRAAGCPSCGSPAYSTLHLHGSIRTASAPKRNSGTNSFLLSGPPTLVPPSI